MEDAQGGSSSLPPFLAKTYEMVDDPSSNSIVSWSQNYRSFVVLNPPEFARILLPRFFKHSNFSSFIRQLNTYGFRKIDAEKWEFANEYFVKGQPRLLKNIHRRKPVHSHSLSHSLQGHSGQGGSSSPLTDSERRGLEEEVERLRHGKEQLGLELQRHEHELQGIEESLKEKLHKIAKQQRDMVSFLDQVLHRPGQIGARERKRRLQRIGYFFDDGDGNSLGSIKEGFDRLESFLDCWECIVHDADRTVDLDESNVNVEVESPDTDMNSEPAEPPLSFEPTGSKRLGAAPAGGNDVFWQQFFTENPGSSETEDRRNESQVEINGRLSENRCAFEEKFLAIVKEKSASHGHVQALVQEQDHLCLFSGALSAMKRTKV